MLLIIRLLSDLHLLNRNAMMKKKQYNIYALIKHTLQIVKQAIIKRGICSTHTLQEKQRPENSQGEMPDETCLPKKNQAMGSGENKLMAQQVQETVHKICKECRELPWLSAAIMQYHNLQKDNFGIGSNSKNYTEQHNNLYSLNYYLKGKRNIMPCFSILFIPRIVLIMGKSLVHQYS